MYSVVCVCVCVRRPATDDVVGGLIVSRASAATINELSPPCVARAFNVCARATLQLRVAVEAGLLVIFDGAFLSARRRSTSALYIVVVCVAGAASAERQRMERSP